MEKKQKGNSFWIGFAMFMFGIVIGFLCAPIKKGIYVGNNSGNAWSGIDTQEDEKDKV